MVSVLLVAVVLTSLGYSFPEAVFIGTLFLPGALAAKYFFPKVSFKSRGTAIKDIIFIVLGILVAEILFFLMAHAYISRIWENPARLFEEGAAIPEILTNPIFIAIILTLLSGGSYLFERWLDKRFPHSPGPITFTSERKPVTLPMEEILYVESNDSITTVVASGNRRFKNKTPISRWEAILGSQFIRIHRAYLVNRSAVSGIDVDILYVGETQLPISRKYKDITL